MAQKCCEAGYDIDPCEVRTYVQKGGTVGRPHLARMLIKKGYFTDIKSVFDTLLYRGGPAYVPYERKTIKECINLIHNAGGCAVLAHPSLVKKDWQTWKNSLLTELKYTIRKTGVGMMNLRLWPKTADFL